MSGQGLWDVVKAQGESMVAEFKEALKDDEDQGGMQNDPRTNPMGAQQEVVSKWENAAAHANAKTSAATNNPNVSRGPPMSNGTQKATSSTASAVAAAAPSIDSGGGGGVPWDGNTGGSALGSLGGGGGVPWDGNTGGSALGNLPSGTGGGAIIGGEGGSPIAVDNGSQSPSKKAPNPLFSTAPQPQLNSPSKASGGAVDPLSSLRAQSTSPKGPPAAAARPIPKLASMSTSPGLGESDLMSHHHQPVHHAATSPAISNQKSEADLHQEQLQASVQAASDYLTTNLPTLTNTLSGLGSTIAENVSSTVRQHSGDTPPDGGGSLPPRGSPMPSGSGGEGLSGRETFQPTLGGGGGGTQTPPRSTGPIPTGITAGSPNKGMPGATPSSSSTSTPFPGAPPSAKGSKSNPLLAGDNSSAAMKGKSSKTRLGGGGLPQDPATVPMPSDEDAAARGWGRFLFFSAIVELVGSPHFNNRLWLWSRLSDVRRFDAAFIHSHH